jgi:hypothetical protein
VAKKLVKAGRLMAATKNRAQLLPGLDVLKGGSANVLASDNAGYPAAFSMVVPMSDQ